MNSSIKSAITQNSNPIIKDDNFKLFKKAILVHYSKTFSSDIPENDLNNIINEYSRLRDRLKEQMFGTQKLDELNKKNLDIHKISACLTLAIYRKMSTIPQKSIVNNANILYIRTTFGYTLSLFLLKMYVKQVNEIGLSENMPIFYFNQKISYDEFLFAYIYNNESAVIIENHIGCIHSLSHIYYLIQELWYSQSIEKG